MALVGALKSWTCLAAGSVIFLPVSAAAQLDDAAVASIFRECRKIEAADARMACYDNVPLGVPSAGEVPGSSARQAAPPVPPTHAAGFGANQLPRRAAESASAPSRITAVLADAAVLTPGVYVLTLEDGTQWQFVDTVGSSYGAPRRGSTVEIAAAALGSYLLTFDSQRAVRVRRVR
jgi:hypothetical protein